ncbi:IS3 family transposase [Paenibacillus chartarius]|uniref:IS3 family transposase n=1 Tax=Paenibacillus chartarius TaxID=747481 RepID=A0ABV6DVL3_9BACL
MELQEELAILKGSAHLRQRKELRFQFIEDHRSEFRVEKMCSVMQVSRSGFYKWRKAMPSELELRKAKVLERVAYYFHDSEGRYGSPKITQLLRKEGVGISERTVGNYMKELGIQAHIEQSLR